VDINVPSYNVGDIVICQIDLRRKPIPSRWEERYRGPFKIIKKITDSILRVRGQFTYARAFNINIKHLKSFDPSSNSVETVLTNIQLKEHQNKLEIYRDFLLSRTYLLLLCHHRHLIHPKMTCVGKTLTKSLSCVN